MLFSVQKVPFVQPVRNYKQLVDGISKCTPKRIPPKTVPKPNGAISALKLTGLAAGFLQNVSPPEFLTSAPSITIKIERRDKRKEQIKLFSLCLAGCVVSVARPTKFLKSFHAF